MINSCSLLIDMTLIFGCHNTQLKIHLEMTVQLLLAARNVGNASGMLVPTVVPP